MKPKTMILMGLAITCGLGASWMTSRLIAGRAPEEQETVNILVAKQNLQPGELLKKPEDQFVFKAVSSKEIPDGAVLNIELIKDKIMKKGLRKGDHITKGELYGTEEQLEIPDGHEALGIRVNLETTASGFASLPRSKVNVVHVVKVNNSDINLSYVQVLMEDVLVLAADTTIDRDKGPSAAAQVVTLALKPQDALKVAGAKAFGELTLTLRKPGDTSRVKNAILTFAEIKMGKTHDAAGAAVPAELVKSFVEAPPQTDTKPVAEKAQDATPPQAEDTSLSNNLKVHNGQDVRTYTYRTRPDGSVIEDDTVESPAPPSESRTTPKRASRGPSEN